MRRILRNVIATISGALVLGSTGLPALAAADAQLKGETPKIDRTIASVGLPTDVAPERPVTRAFKLNAGITQEYVLGPGDILSVADLSSEGDKPDTTMSPILPDGTAVINYAGVIEAAGHSIREMNELVNERAKKYFKNPAIVINLAKQRSTQVYMLGELNHPGLYSPDKAGGGDGSISTGGGESDSDSKGDEKGGTSAQMPVAQPNFTLAGALEMAGGLKETADIRHIHVTRLHPKQVIDVDLVKLMLDGDVSEDVALQPGDVVYVPKGGSEFNVQQFGKMMSGGTKVRVIGAVSTPGLITLSPDDDMLSAIAKAGGFKETAAKGTVHLFRTSRDGTVAEEKVNIKETLKNGAAIGRMKVRPGDVIVVDTSTTKLFGSYMARYAPQYMMQILMTGIMYSATSGR